MVLVFCCFVRGRGDFGRLLPLPLAFFPAPIPPTPFPAGRGRIILYFAGGSAPGTPGIRPPAALTEPAKQMPGGRLLPLRHLFAQPRGRGPSQTPPSRQRRIVPSPPVPPLLGCRRCSWEPVSTDFAVNHEFSPPADRVNLGTAIPYGKERQLQSI